MCRILPEIENDVAIREPKGCDRFMNLKLANRRCGTGKTAQLPARAIHNYRRLPFGIVKTWPVPTRLNESRVIAFAPIDGSKRNRSGLSPPTLVRTDEFDGATSD